MFAFQYKRFYQHAFFLESVTHNDLHNSKILTEAIRSDCLNELKYHIAHHEKCMNTFVNDEGICGRQFKQHLLIDDHNIDKLV